MDLWIRSQDKQCLIKSADLCIIYNQEGNTYEIDSFNGSEDTKVFLAEYFSSRRAEEVLNEVHQRLIDLQTIEYTKDYRFTNKRSLDCVYQMPEE